MPGTPAGSTPDALSQALDSFRLRGSMSAQIAVRSPWGFSVPLSRDLGLLVVTRGRICFEMEGVENGRLELATGDVVAIPNGDAFTLRDAPDSPVVPITEQIPCDEPQVAMPGAQTEFIVMRCALTGGCTNPVRTGLPRLLHLPGSDGSVARWLEPTVRLLALEGAAPPTGRIRVLDRLAEVILIHVIRAWLDRQSTECRGWLHAIADPQLSRAMASFHAEPGRPWTIEALAAAAGMSRSAFAARFKALTGATPLDYLTDWRMQQARTMIETGEKPLKQIVTSLGYASQAAFRTAFKRRVGQTPGSYRTAFRAGDTSP